MSPPPRVRSAAYSFLAGNSHQPQSPRHSHTPRAACNRRDLFSTSSRLLHATSREPTLYEILDVPVTASMSDIKKQFYTLSLHHHPDRNRTDPTASSRFARISSAYQVLGNATKRASYDRDHGIHAHLASSSTHSTANPGRHPMGSYSSHNANVHSKGASYAGSRPASGLSKRRGVFKGPPPSFYAHGGYGVHGRRGASPGGTGGGGGGGGGSAAGGAAAGEKRDEDPTSFVDRNSVNHFNARGHYRTQSAEDARRQQRRSKEMSAALNEQYIGGPGDYAIRFTLVCCMLIGAGALTGFLWPREKSKKASSRRRDN